MLPFQNASGMFQDQMRSKLGFGPSNPSPASPFTPHNTGPAGPGHIMDGQGRLGGSGMGGVTGGYHNGGVVGSGGPPRQGGGLGQPPGNTGPIGPNGPGGPYGGGSSTGPVESSTGNNPGSVLGGWNLGGAFNPTAPQTPKPFINFDSLNKPVPAGQAWDYGASANTALNGHENNPYGPFGVSVGHSAGYLYPGGGTSYVPQSGMYGSSFGQAPSLMPDQFANMNYNLPIYGNIQPYPGA